MNTAQRELMNGINAMPNSEKPEYYMAYNKIRENHNLDVNYNTQMDTLLNELNGSLVEKQKKKDIQLLERKKDIEEYYYDEYTQQIYIIQCAVAFAVLALGGGMLYRAQLFTQTVLMVYLGIVASIAFVVVGYYLWDLYSRDATVFDEYNFARYNSLTHSNPTENVYTELDANLLSC
jgi:hypothetical protein